MISYMKHNLGAAFVAIGIVAPVLWMAMDREVPYVRTGGELIPSAAHKGDTVEVKWHVVPKKACPQASDNSVKRSIITKSGRIVYFLPVYGVVGGNKNEVDRKNINRQFQIPTDIEAGPARYRAEACFACNPIQHFFPVCVTEPEIPFEILERTNDGR